MTVDLPVAQPAQPLQMLELDLEDPTERMPRALLDAALEALVDESFEFVTTRGESCHF